LQRQHSDPDAALPRNPSVRSNAKVGGNRFYIRKNANSSRQVADNLFSLWDQSLSNFTSSRDRTPLQGQKEKRAAFPSYMSFFQLKPSQTPYQRIIALTHRKQKDIGTNLVLVEFIWGPYPLSHFNFPGRLLLPF
jgi:hypothetical protein